MFTTACRKDGACFCKIRLNVPASGCLSLVANQSVGFRNTFFFFFFACHVPCFWRCGEVRPSKLMEAQNSCLCFQMELQLQAAPLTQASSDCIVRLASSFQFVFVIPQVLPPTIFWRKSLRKDSKGQNDNILPSEMAFLRTVWDSKSFLWCRKGKSFIWRKIMDNSEPWSFWVISCFPFAEIHHKFFYQNSCI